MNQQKIMLLGAALAAPILAAVLIGVNSPDPEVGKGAAPAAEPAARAGLAQSSDKVKLAVIQGSDARETLDADEIVVELKMDAGWHVNANPATMDFLIPTVVQVTAGGEPLDLAADYPAGRVSDITLDETAIEVYDDGVRIRLRPDQNDLAKLNGGDDLKVLARVQACSDSGVCLAPSDLSATMAAPASER